MRVSFPVLAALLLTAATAPFVTMLAAAPAAAQSIGRTWANPVDIDYKYNFEQTHEGVSYRTGAEPTVVLHQDRYYLFVTQADGYWVSRDLAEWSFVEPNRWPLDGSVGPAAVSDGERLYLMQSSLDPLGMLASDRPETGRWDFYTRRMPRIPGAVTGRDPAPGPNTDLPAGPWSPDLFIDNDNRWYLYWGSSDVFPLYGSEIDPISPMAFIDEPTTMFRLDPARHGWERYGQDHSGTLPDGTPVAPYIDGASMTRNGGRYYLQYSAPGAEYNGSANGAYVGTSPLGPFTYAPWNPTSYKPGGFVQGAGNGSTFQDRYGNWWNTGGAWIGLNWSFERRVAMFPGAFHTDGQLYFSSRFGDFPQRTPDGPVLNPESLFTGWMPLSYKAKATASSTEGVFTADRAVDEDPRTFWVAQSNTPDQTLTLDLGAVKVVQSVQVNYADYQSGMFENAPNQRTRFRIQWSLDGEQWFTLANRMSSNRDSPNAYVQAERPTRARFIRYQHGETPGAHLAIADLRVFGNATGPLPLAPAEITVTRGKDQRNATVKVAPVADPAGGRILGYNIRWGVRADRLHLTYQVWADELAARGGQVEIGALNVGVDYFFAVEAFGDTGVSPLSAVASVPAGATAAVSAQTSPALSGLGPATAGATTVRPDGTIVTVIPPVYISGGPAVSGTGLPASGNAATPPGSEPASTAPATAPSTTAPSTTAPAADEPAEHEVPPPSPEPSSDPKDD
ncbi:discoidin domain-containing protein [Brevundimonas sp.]|jgi:xylan 1,4-beta-xylosidase|uniref:discoidin domain-containing protein n=1 Tax=Brevundimonas sp. TaxID=1871086 RepID=UPI00378502D2